MTRKSLIASAKVQTSEGVAYLSGQINMNKNVFQISKAFHEARIAGEEKLLRGEISFEEYSFVMLGFEAELKVAGVSL